MAFILNGTEIPSTWTIKVGNTNITKIVCSNNNATVWEKKELVITSVNWQPAWSGTLIMPWYMGDLDPATNESDIGKVSAGYTNLTSSAIQKLAQYQHLGLIQAGANLLVDIRSSTGATVIDGLQLDFININRSSTNLTGNLPWSPTASGIEGTQLNMIGAGASGVQQTATAGWYWEDYTGSGEYGVFFEYFEILTLYYGVPTYS